MPERLAPADWLKKWTHEEIDAGADIIVMHGAPLVHGVEIYHKRPIFYDLGNFIFNVPPVDIQLDEPIFWESVVAHVEFQGKNLRSITFQPIALNKIGQGQPDLQDEHTNNLFLQTRGLPRPATADQAGYILQRLADSSRPFGTKVTVLGDQQASCRDTRARDCPVRGHPCLNGITDREVVVAVAELVSRGAA